MLQPILAYLLRSTYLSDVTTFQLYICTCLPVSHAHPFSTQVSLHRCSLRDLYIWTLRDNVTLRELRPPTLTSTLSTSPQKPRGTGLGACHCKGGDWISPSRTIWRAPPFCSPSRPSHIACQPADLVRPSCHTFVRA